jgi:PleD family two-component response regulator
MGSADHSKSNRCNLKLVNDDQYTVQAIRLAGFLEVPAKPDQKMLNRIDELEQQVKLLEQQLEVERRLAQMDPLTGIANRRAFCAR